MTSQELIAWHWQQSKRHADRAHSYESTRAPNWQANGSRKQSQFHAVAAVAVETLQRENEALKHDIARHVALASEEATRADGLTSAARDVLAERERQISQEGWTPEHDDAHQDGTMAKAGACYAAHAAAGASLNDQGSDAYKSIRGYEISPRWPWSQIWWKPNSPRRDLVKAAALILAEIERIDRSLQSGSKP